MQSRDFIFRLFERAKCFLWRSWGVPLVALLSWCAWVLVVVVWDALAAAGLVSVDSLSPLLLHVLTGLVVLWCVAPWAVLVKWLLVLTLLCCKRREWRRLLSCWGCGGLAAGLAFLLAILFVFSRLTGGGATMYTWGASIPEDRDFVVPRDLGEYVGDVKPASARARELLNRRPGRMQPLHLMQLPELPNLEKLTREAPELLQEYLLRCLYAEATRPGFDAQVLTLKNDTVLLAHENDPQTHALRNPDLEREVWMNGRGYLYSEMPAWKWNRPLHGGWSVVLHPREILISMEYLPQIVGGRMLMLDTSLRRLAENPTRAYLDSILPPVPQKPFLCMWKRDGAGGCYRALVILPADFPAGSVQLRAREVSTGKPVDFTRRNLPITRLGEVCSVACDELQVRSGDLNEFYASVWEIWFTPAGGGASRCAGSQEFLLMGGLY